MTTRHCPLCKHDKACDFFTDKRRHYWQCQHCFLVYLDPDERLSASQEKAEYDLHDNNPEDPNYRRFLSRLSIPLTARLKQPGKGLDFGCGPGPTLGKMLAEHGHHIENYDRFYANDKSLLEQQYDFITASEVVEHLFKPGDVLLELWQQLNNGGYLALMTKLLIDREAFSHWHYKNDPTHVCFFSRSSFQYLASTLGAELTFIGNDVILLRKPLPGS